MEWRRRESNPPHPYKGPQTPHPTNAFSLHMRQWTRANPVVVRGAMAGLHETGRVHAEEGPGNTRGEEDGREPPRFRVGRALTQRRRFAGRLPTPPHPDNEHP